MPRIGVWFTVRQMVVAMAVMAVTDANRARFREKFDLSAPSAALLS
jgi:hypothetical protein